MENSTFYNLWNSTKYFKLHNLKIYFRFVPTNPTNTLKNANTLKNTVQ